MVAVVTLEALSFLYTDVRKSECAPNKLVGINGILPPRERLDKGEWNSRRAAQATLSKNPFFCYVRVTRLLSVHTRG